VDVCAVSLLIRSGHTSCTTKILYKIVIREGRHVVRSKVQILFYLYGIIKSWQILSPNKNAVALQKYNKITNCINFIFNLDWRTSQRRELTQSLRGMANTRSSLPIKWTNLFRQVCSTLAIPVTVPEGSRIARKDIAVSLFLILFSEGLIPCLHIPFSFCNFHRHAW
jgi:hypothetical protein